MNAFGMLKKVRERYTGARESFVLARLTLRTGIDVAHLTPQDDDPAKAAKLRQAILEICKDVDLK